MEITEAEIQLKVNESIDRASDKIADKCVERIKNAQHDCEAFRIFRDKENVKRFYNTADELDDHIEMHKKKEVWFKWITGILIVVFCSDKFYAVVKWWINNS